MDASKIDMYVMTNQKYLPAEKIVFIKEKLKNVDEERFAPAVREKLSALEEKFKSKAEDAEDAARAAVREGKSDAAKAILAALTEECTEQLYALATAECARLASFITSVGGLYGRQKEELERYAEYAEMDLLR